MARLVLVGIGHANLEVLRRCIVEARDDVELTVVSLSDRQHYSGMVPGYLRGTYSEDDIVFDLRALTFAAGGELVEARAIGIDPGRCVVRLGGGGEVGYDLVSFNVGSRSAGQERPSVRAHAVSVTPLSQVEKLRRRLDDLASSQRSRRAGVLARVAVVGGGAAGVEIACVAAELLDETDRERRVFLLEASEYILSGYSRHFRQRAERVLAEKQVGVRTSEAVGDVSADALELESGEKLRSDLTIWLTGAAAVPLFEGSGLACDERGFLLVDESLRSVSDPRVLGAGDCVTLERYPDTPKAGVYAVRQGPVLWDSIAAALDGSDPPSYTPQHGFLSILNTADGKALLRYKRLVSHSRWAWWLKDWIDRRFMRRYQDLAAGRR